MNTGQMLITIGAVMLLSIVILNVNRGFLWTESTMEVNRYEIMATSFATSTIEKATRLAFDNESDSVAITDKNLFTLPSKLGMETGESAGNPDGFNDVDDYNCYKTTPKLDSIVINPEAPPSDRRVFYFNTYCSVDYVDEEQPDNVVTTKTWHKRIKVRVESPDLKDELYPVEMSTVYSYWYFR